MRRLLAPALACLAAACAPVLPPIAGPGGDARLKARIADTYRPGSPAERLRARLLAEGFVVVEDRRAGRASAFFAPDNQPCE
ncbi:MAG: hypothetical protein JO048_00935, partial [Methylobacteriaceae bacterium]|nr:hypothetical protein [Methylobacteriaceae bacterium]